MLVWDNVEVGKWQASGGSSIYPKAMGKSCEEMHVFGLDVSLSEVQAAVCERNLESLKS